MRTRARRRRSFKAPRWTAAEEELFYQALRNGVHTRGGFRGNCEERIYNWAAVSEVVGTKDRTQCALKNLWRERSGKMSAQHPTRPSPAPALRRREAKAEAQRVADEAKAEAKRVRDEKRAAEAAARGPCSSCGRMGHTTSRNPDCPMRGLSRTERVLARRLLAEAAHGHRSMAELVAAAKVGIAAVKKAVRERPAGTPFLISVHAVDSKISAFREANQALRAYCLLDGVGSWTNVLVPFKDISVIASIVEGETHAWGANVLSLRPWIGWSNVGAGRPP